MIDSQWFALAYAGSVHQLNVKHEKFSCRNVIINPKTGPDIVIYCGQNVITDENNEYFSLAIGDCRNLSPLLKNADFIPNRHASILKISKNNGKISLITDTINFNKIFYHKNEKINAIATSVSLLSQKEETLSVPGLACFLANGTQFNGETVYKKNKTFPKS